jgi:lipoate-protein ligase A
MTAVCESAGPGETWRLLPFHRGSSALHFRLSDALSRHAAVPTIWWHSAARSTLILGPTQKSGAPEPTPELEVVRRTSGGGAVLAGADVLGLDVALPATHPLVLPDVVSSYRWLGETWREALAVLGIAARVATPEEAREDRLPDDLREDLRRACFGTLSPFEVVVGGRKLVGLAQIRRRTATLLQAGIHREFAPDVLAGVIAPRNAHTLAAELARRAAGLHEIAGRAISDEDIFDAFNHALDRLHAVTLQPGEWSADELAAAETGPVR